MSCKRVFLFFPVIILSLLLAACSSQPPKTDKESFQDFYRAVMSKAKAIDEMYAPFHAATQSGRNAEAMQIAAAIQGKIRDAVADMSVISVPALKDPDAAKAVREAHQYLTGAYAKKSEVVKTYLEIRASGGSSQQVAQIKEQSDKFQSWMIAGLAQLVTAGAKVGIPPSEIQALQK